VSRDQRNRIGGGDTGRGGQRVEVGDCGTARKVPSQIEGGARQVGDKQPVQVNDFASTDSFTADDYAGWRMVERPDDLYGGELVDPFGPMERGGSAASDDSPTPRP
jgi:hypothetical protein